MKDKIMEKIKDIIMNDIPRNKERDEINENSLLIDDLELDSVSLMKLIVDIEEAFSIEFSDEFLLISILTTVGSLADYVTSLEEQRNE